MKTKALYDAPSLPLWIRMHGVAFRAVEKEQRDIG